MTDKNPAVELLIIYNEIDAFLRQQSNSDRHAEHSFLLQQAAKSNAVIARHESELRAIAQLRNNIVHNPLGDTISPIATPHPELIKRYSQIRNHLLKPQTALSIAIPASKLYTAALKSPLNEVLKAMDQHIFTHVPIIENNQMIGVFSENTILSYLADNYEVIILGNMTIADFSDYLPLAAHKGERFAFLPRRASLSDVYKVFNQAIEAKQRIGMVFVTEHGRDSEKPLGVITAWDLAAPIFDTQA